MVEVGIEAAPSRSASAMVREELGEGVPAHRGGAKQSRG